MIHEEGIKSTTLKILFIVKLSNMKVAFVSGVFFPDPGGVQVQIHNFANKLISLGHNIKVFIFSDSKQKNNKYQIVVFNKIIINLVYFMEYYFKINLTFILNFYISLIVNKYKFDLWHFNFINYKSLLLIKALRKNNQKIIVTFHGADIQINEQINYGNRLNKKYDFLLKKTLDDVNAYTYISNTIKQDMLNIGIKKENLFHIPNSVNLDKFEKIEKTKKYTDELNFITVARFSEKKKGYDLVENIARKLIDKKIKFKWRIIGDKVTKLKDFKFFYENLKYFELINNIDNQDEIYFPHSKLIQYYKISDLYVNLSRIESFGITYLESLASKVPIISYVSKGSNEIIINNFNGFLISSNNENEFVNKILELSYNKKLIYGMKKNCSNSIEKFDLNTIISKLIVTYEQVKKFKI